MTEPRRSAVILDLDGTLVDSVYHHVVAWESAFREHGYDIPRWRVHRVIGMGSDRLLPHLLGERPEDEEALKDSHFQRFTSMADDLRPTNGARALIADLEDRDVPFIIATSAGAKEREILMSALGREDLETTDSDDVGSSKPSPDLVLTACDRLGVEPSWATLIGDSRWDHESARRVHVRSIGVRCGGFGDAAMRDAGAMDVVDDPQALIGRL